MLVATKLLSWQNYVCCNKSFVVTNTCRDRHVLVESKLFCLDKHTFVTPKDVFCHDKHMFVTQKYACHDKTKIFVVTSFVVAKIFCCDKHNSVATKLLSWQAYFCRGKRCVLSQQTRVCRDKTFVMTKMILVAAPANDNWARFWENRKVWTEWGVSCCLLLYTNINNLSFFKCRQN